MDSGLVAIGAGLLTGGPLLAYIALRKAPVERDSLRVTQAGQVTEDALELLEAERARFASTLEPLTRELEAMRRDRQHDHEQCRQLGVANEALRDLVEDRDREIARLRAALDERSP